MPPRLRVLMVTQAVDRAHPLLTVVPAWIDALAPLVRSLDVLCLEADDSPRPQNVSVRAIGGHGASSQLRRLFRFEQAAWEALGEADVVFTHMSPRLACLAAIPARLRHVPTVLWYVHRAVTAELRAARALCRAVATATPRSFPLAGPDVHVLGHGVDASFFTPAGVAHPAGPSRIVMVGRLSPVKRQDVLVDALPLILARHPEAHVCFAGDAPDEAGRAYRDRLEARATALGVAARVSFLGSLDPAAVRDLLRSASVAVNLSPSGLFDKAALESLLTATPTIVASEDFDPVLGSLAPRLRLPAPSAAAAAEVIGEWLSRSPDERRTSMEEVRTRTAALHGLDAFAGRLVGLLESIA